MIFVDFSQTLEYQLNSLRGGQKNQPAERDGEYTARGETSSPSAATADCCVKCFELSRVPRVQAADTGR